MAKKMMSIRIYITSWLFVDMVNFYQSLPKTCILRVILIASMIEGGMIIMSTNHVAAEEGERDEYGRGEDRLTEFLTLVENCISANQLRNACLDIKMVEEIRVKIK